MALINSGHLSVPKYYLVSILVLLEVISKNALAHLLPRPAPPSHSLVFFKCPCTLPLSTTSMWTSDSHKHFLEPSRRELKESLKVTLKTPGSIPRPLHPILLSLHSMAWFPVSLRAAPHTSGAGLSAGLPQPPGGHRSSPKTHIFDFSGKAVWQHWAHISTWAQMAGAK